MARDSRTTWRESLSDALNKAGESWSDIISSTLTEAELDESFDAGYGGAEGKPFTAWTIKRTYFPCEYDGAEWVGSVSRVVDGEPTPHSGL